MVCFWKNKSSYPGILATGDGQEPMQRTPLPPCQLWTNVESLHYTSHVDYEYLSILCVMQNTSLILGTWFLSYFYLLSACKLIHQIAKVKLFNKLWLNGQQRQHFESYLAHFRLELILIFRWIWRLSMFFLWVSSTCLDPHTNNISELFQILCFLWLSVQSVYYWISILCSRAS